MTDPRPPGPNPPGPHPLHSRPPGSGQADLDRARDRRRVMADYDDLPPALRGWLAGARLQWSPASARRAWRRALWRSLGRTNRALAIMDRLEDDRIARDGAPGAGPDRES